MFDGNRSYGEKQSWEGLTGALGESVCVIFKRMVREIPTDI